MDCSTCRELISASIDDDLSLLERQAMRVHVARCPKCVAHGRQILELDRALGSAARSVVPDLSSAILARHESDQRAGRAGDRVQVLRFALFGVGIVQLLLSIDQLIHETPFSSHLSRDLGGWDLAFAVGLLVCAIHPGQARGLLPMVVAVVAVITITMAIDIGRDVVSVATELPHLAEFLGLFLLWLLARNWPRTTATDGDGRDGPGLSPVEAERILEPVER